MNTPISKSFRMEVQNFAQQLINSGKDVETVYDKVRERYGDLAIQLVADCYFELSRV
jgi:hypothetical protein